MLISIPLQDIVVRPKSEVLTDDDTYEEEGDEGSEGDEGDENEEDDANDERENKKNPTDNQNTQSTNASTIHEANRKATKPKTKVSKKRSYKTESQSGTQSVKSTQSTISAYGCEIYDFLEPVIFSLASKYEFQSRIVLDEDKGIYKCRDLKTDQVVAIKISPEQGMPKQIRMLEHIRRSGGHPHVQELLQVYVQEVQDKLVWVMVTPFYQEDCIRKCVKKVKHSIFLTQLCEAVSFLHQIGITHRDIKPHNILWNDEKNDLVLIDFDVSCFHDRPRTKITGTEGFMAPEMLNLERDVPNRNEHYNELVDEFSIGCVGLCLAFEISEYDCCESIINRKRSLLSDAILLGLLEHDPSKRFTANRALDLFNHTS